jgi:protease IV
MATSGGYYIAVAGDYIFAQPTTITGNVGVYMPRFNFSKIMEKYGVEETTIAAEGSTYKNAGSSYKPENPEETLYLRGIIDEAYSEFKNVVANGRKGKLKSEMSEVANGKAYTAKQSLAMGLIDAIGYSEDAYNHAAQLAGLKDKYVVRYTNPPSLMDLFSMESNLPEGISRMKGSGGIHINIDAGLLHEMTTPRLMYMWRGE